jgi:hypothetical protein
MEQNKIVIVFDGGCLTFGRAALPAMKTTIAACRGQQDVKDNGLHCEARMD